MGKASFVLLCFSLSLLISLSNAGSSAKVYDMVGKPLRTSKRYYIYPVMRGQGGGLVMSGASGNKSCPLDQIIQDPLEVNDGLALQFTPVNFTKPGLVYKYTNYYIKFFATSICGQSTIWRLGDYDESKKTYFLTTGGIEANPENQTITNWFKIEEYDNYYYKLRFRPIMCIHCKVISGEVGLYVGEEDGKRRLGLGLSDEFQEFPVLFKKA